MYGVLIVCDLETSFDHSALNDYLSLRDGEKINKFTTRLELTDLQEFFDDIYNITYDGDIVQICYKDLDDPDAKMMYVNIRKKSRKNTKSTRAVYTCD